MELHSQDRGPGQDSSLSNLVSYKAPQRAESLETRDLLRDTEGSKENRKIIGLKASVSHRYPWGRREQGSRVRGTWIWPPASGRELDKTLNLWES